MVNLWLSIDMNKLASFPQKDLAERLKVSPAAVSRWFKRGRVPLGRVFEIEAIFGVSRYDLRPDFFGPNPNTTGPTPRTPAMSQEATA